MIKIDSIVYLLFSFSIAFGCFMAAAALSGESSLAGLFGAISIMCSLAIAIISLKKGNKNERT